jgi:chaperonin GroEL
MIKALKEPFNQIYKNAEVEYTEEQYNEILNNYGTGLDIETGETINLFERGIIDPAKVARVAIENSSSVASTFLTVGASVFNSEPIVRPTGIM